MTADAIRDGECRGKCGGCPDDACAEAAAEITRLRADVATLTDERDSARIWRDVTEADMANHTATVEGLFAENAALRAAIQRHRDNVWGSGRVGHVEDTLLYAALVQDADA